MSWRVRQLLAFEDHVSSMYLVALKTQHTYVTAESHPFDISSLWKSSTLRLKLFFLGGRAMNHLRGFFFLVYRTCQGELWSVCENPLQLSLCPPQIWHAVLETESICGKELASNRLSSGHMASAGLQHYVTRGITSAEISAEMKQKQQSTPTDTHTHTPVYNTHTSLQQTHHFETHHSTSLKDTSLQ
jgi:hypothetical protein